MNPSTSTISAATGVAPPPQLINWLHSGKDSGVPTKKGLVMPATFTIDLKVADNFKDITVVMQAHGLGPYIIDYDTEMEMGLVTFTQTPTVLPYMNDPGRAVKLVKPMDSSLKIWAKTYADQTIRITPYRIGTIFDTTGTTSA